MAEGVDQVVLVAGPMPLVCELGHEHGVDERANVRLHRTLRDVRSTGWRASVRA